jgi:hypothetical protein
MAFTFIVETGLNVTGSNTYVSIAEANTFLSANIHAYETWSNLDLDVQKQLLVWASRYIDQRAIWNGTPVYDDQNMRWPRTGAYDRDDLYVLPTVIPKQVKEATMEMARYLMATERSIERDQDGLKSITVDVIQVDFLRNYSLPEVPSSISLIIRGLGTISSGGTNFAPIRKS